MTHLNYFRNSFLKEGKWHISREKKGCIIWESFMARNCLCFMHFWKQQIEILKRNYILITFSYWSQGPVSSCETNLCSWIFWPPCPWFLSPFGNHFLRNIKPLRLHVSPLKIRPGWAMSHLLEGKKNDRYDKNSSPGICTWPEFKALWSGQSTEEQWADGATDWMY